jgi:6-pyruvoyltetrahydropterin/6-carboxytetrahydropterin synthase
MRFELTQRFHFDAAHTLQRQYEAEPSKRVHGHTYHAAVTVSGTRNQDTGMVVDLALLRRVIEGARRQLDHHLLDEVEGLGAPTIENLCAFIFRAMQHEAWTVERVEVGRPTSGDACALIA